MPASVDRHAWVYILASRGHGTLYVGIASDLRTRIWQHKAGIHEGFSKRYRLKRPVHFEEFRNMRSALDRERALKGWTRARKIGLIERENSAWADLAPGWFDDGVDPSLRSG